MMTADPHRDLPVTRLGVPVERAKGAVILLHGRGGSAEDILSLAPLLELPDVTFLAPQASEGAWYPYSFLAPLEQNEPALTSALSKVQSTMQIALDAGVPADKVVIAGFSQGACLSSEFVARHPRRYAAIVAFTGGLIGPPTADLRHSGQLLDTPALFTSGDPDPHVPWSRVEESAEILRNMGAKVTIKRYAGRPHIVSQEELDLARDLLRIAL